MRRNIAHAKSVATVFLRLFPLLRRRFPQGSSTSLRKGGRTVFRTPPRRSTRPRTFPFSAFLGCAPWCLPSGTAGPPDPSGAGRVDAVCAGWLFAPPPGTYSLERVWIGFFGFGGNQSPGAKTQAPKEARG